MLLVCIVPYSSEQMCIMDSTPSSTLVDVYRNYIKAVLNHDLDRISDYVSENVVHNGKQLGLSGYKELLLRNIMHPNVKIDIKRLVADDSHVAALLIFTTSKQTQELVGISLKDDQFSYAENVFYDFSDSKIIAVHSLFDIDTVRAHTRDT